MLNVYQLDQKQRVLEETRQKERKARQMQAKSLRMREELVDGYNSRVQKFLHDMNEKPIVVKTFRNTEYQFRELDNSKILGAKVISPNRWLTEKKRIAETLENNKIYFTEANLDKFKLLKRGRESLKDIQPKMKYKSYSTLSRVAEAIKESMPLRELEMGKQESRGSNSTSSYLPSYMPHQKRIQNLKIKPQADQSQQQIKVSNRKKQGSQPHYSQKSLTSRNFYDTATQSSSAPQAKDLHGDLHNKTHFKAAMALQVINPQTSKQQFGSFSSQTHCGQRKPSEGKQHLLVSTKSKNKINRASETTQCNPLVEKKVRLEQQLIEAQASRSGFASDGRDISTVLKYGSGSSSILNKLVNKQIFNDGNSSLAKPARAKHLRFSEPAATEQAASSSTLPKLSSLSLFQQIEDEVMKDELVINKSNKDKLRDSQSALSKNVLIKCNIMNNRGSQGLLRKGEGHLVSNPETSNKDLTLTKTKGSSSHRCMPIKSSML